jgi:6-phosphofructokinase 1
MGFSLPTTKCKQRVWSGHRGLCGQRGQRSPFPINQISTRAISGWVSAGHVERLGGVGEVVAGQLRELTGKETRTVVLGHLLRGGQPTSLDRSLGLIFGAAAVRGLAESHNGVMVAVNPPRIDYIPLKVATAKLKLVAADDYGVMTARTLDISFGDTPVVSGRTHDPGRRAT